MTRGMIKKKHIKQLTEIMKLIFEESVMPKILKKFKMQLLQKLSGL